jgi:hypothetical protein
MLGIPLGAFPTLQSWLMQHSQMLHHVLKLGGHAAYVIHHQTNHNGMKCITIFITE